MLERRTGSVELRAISDDGATRIAWYPALFDSLSEDLGGFRERISRRAFTRALQEDDFVALLNHSTSNLPLGRIRSGTLAARADATGLHAEVTLPDSNWGRDIAETVRRGDINAGSFGFSVVKDSWDKGADGSIVRTLQEVRLWDVSLVVFPAYPGTAGSTMVRDLSEVLAALNQPAVPAIVNDPRARRERELRLLELRR